MSLQIKTIRFKNFRNYTELSLNSLSGLVIIIGDNAVGKTNIVEGIQLLTALKSFRKPGLEDLIKSGEDTATLEVSMIDNMRELTTRLMIKEGKREYYLNAKKIKRDDLLGLIPTVVFIPDDLLIIKGSSRARRDVVDDLGCQLSRTFNDIKRDYNRIVKQKNLLLKEEDVDIRILDSWNQNLIKLGSALLKHRVTLFLKLVEKIKAIYSYIAPNEDLTAKYIPSWSLNDVENNEIRKETISEDFTCAIEKEKNAEICSHKSIIGPHHDNIIFYIDKKDSRRFASQGQQRSLALAIKLAEVEIIREMTCTEPLLLLDDVMSELDEKRRNFLLSYINNNVQTFITTTNIGYFNEKILSEAEVIRLPLNV